MCSGQSWNPAGIVCTAGVWADAAAANDTPAADTMAATDNMAPVERTKRRVFLVLKPELLAYQIAYQVPSRAGT